jgi:hypothetical protein
MCICCLATCCLTTYYDIYEADVKRLEYYPACGRKVGIWARPIRVEQPFDRFNLTPAVTAGQVEAWLDDRDQSLS